MQLKEIQDLIKLVSKSDVSEVSLEKKDFKLTIKSETQEREQVFVQAAAPVASVPAPAPAVPPVAPAPVANSAQEAPQASADDSKYVTIKSPMIGTFYRKPTPDKPTFVEVGDSVKPGDVLCIVEAMKLFNEIESEVSGTIVKVLVDDNSPIEYDQPLFLVDPS